MAVEIIVGKFEMKQFGRCSCRNVGNMEMDFKEVWSAVLV
jgi:hypothetical protein